MNLFIHRPTPAPPPAPGGPPPAFADTPLGQWWHSWRLPGWLRLLLGWALPLAVLATHLREPLFAYQASDYARAVYGFPFAFEVLMGAGSLDNVVSIAPYLLDLAIMGGIIQLTGMALLKLLRPLPARIVLAVSGVGAWPFALLIVYVMWSENWRVDWWSLGQIAP